MRKYNVTSGPALFPKLVLEKLSSGIIDYEGHKISILEIAHRSALFDGIRNELIEHTRELLQVPKNYSAMYLQGGGRLHLTQLPMNFLQDHQQAIFIDTGYWSRKAEQYARNYGATQLIGSGLEDGYLQMPELNIAGLKGSYLQYCSNNTIQGTCFPRLLSSTMPTIIDMSSEIFSRAIDFTKVDAIIACAQKNIGPAGVSLLIVKNDFLATAKENVPSVFSYKNLAAANSNYSTPPIFQICACLEMLRWMQSMGGVSKLSAAAEQRAQLLYNAIDQSSKVNNHVAKDFRSVMNIVFDATDETTAKHLQEKFTNSGILGIHGHVSRGGFRVGNYLAQESETMERVADVIS